jgi:hypothetical protein
LGELQMVLASSTVANTPTHSFPLTGFTKELEDVYKDATGCISFSEKTSSRKRVNDSVTKSLPSRYLLVM